MPAHDIIDNRTEKLVDHLSEMLGSSERARFAVGYLFLSGLTSVAKRLLSLKELLWDDDAYSLKSPNKKRVPLRWFNLVD